MKRTVSMTPYSSICSIEPLLELIIVEQPLSSPFFSLVQEISQFDPEI
jgi:hypothetical protein